MAAEKRRDGVCVIRVLVNERDKECEGVFVGFYYCTKVLVFYPF